MSPRRLLTAVLVGTTVLAVTGCTKSHVKANAKITLTGKVLAPDGGPARSAGVSLLKRPDAGEVIGGLTVGLATLGLVCAADTPPAICRSVRRAVTDPGGSYSYELRGSDTQGSIGNADTLDVAAAAPGPGGAITSAAFKVQHERVVIPILRLWDAGLRFAGPALTPSWNALPGDAPTGGSQDTTLQFTDPSGTPVWEQPHATSGGRFDPRVLEDAAVDARVRIDTSVNRRTGSYDLDYLSAGTHLTGQAGAPASRGAPCITPRPHGVAGVAGTPCWLTDGDLAGRPPLHKKHSAAVIDLGSVQPVSLITVRGEPASRTISVSADGVSFRPLGTRHTGFEYFRPEGVTARYVRVKTPGGIDGTRELSVWTAS